MRKISGLILTAVTLSSGAFAASRKKIDCLQYLKTDSPSLFIKVNKKEQLDDSQIAKIQDYQTRRELEKASSVQAERLNLGFDFDLDIVLKRLEYRDVDFYKTQDDLGLSLVKSLYDITPSSRDESGDNPFGVVALGTETGQISETCSAQMSPLSVDELTGELYAQTKNGKVLIAKPLVQLPTATELETIYGNYHEYKLVDGLKISKATFAVKQRSSYSFKKMRLTIEQAGRKRNLRLSSFD
jgi:hypothetical protein